MAIDFRLVLPGRQPGWLCSLTVPLTNQQSHETSPTPLHHSNQCAVCSTSMATPFFVGIGAIAAGLAGRHFLRRSARGAADQWVKGGFKAKMDRKEALAILGLKCVYSRSPPLLH